MKHIAKQTGSSTIGLIAATGLFVGLMIYTTQYAFVKESDNSAAKIKSDQPESTLLSIIPTKIGEFFQSESVVSEKEKARNSISETKTSDIKTREIKTPEMNTDTNGAQELANDSSPRSEDLKNLESKSATSSKEVDSVTSQVLTKQTHLDKSISIYPMQANSVIPAYRPLKDQLHAMQQYQSRSYMNNQYQKYGTGYGKSYGRAQVNRDVKGDGQFDFSMRFKSRANMNADTNWDSRFNTDSNANQVADFQQEATINPSYQTYYRQY